jgi:hypothetical protein
VQASVVGRRKVRGAYVSNILRLYYKTPGIGIRMRLHMYIARERERVCVCVRVVGSSRDSCSPQGGGAEVAVCIHAMYII